MTVQESSEDVEAPQSPKDGRTPLPKLQLFIVYLIQFTEPVTATVIYPFVNELVRETGITGGDETRTGYYAGIIESTFFFSETCTVFAWGWLSDGLGRRPVLLLGPLGLAVSMLGFGLSKSFWPLVYLRTLQGIFNGNIGVSKSVMAEITDSTNIGDAYALGPAVWGAALTIGPTIGGVLSNTATRWPETFGKFAFLHKYPYFLPCAAAAVLSFVSFLVASIALKETLPASRKVNLRSWRRFGPRSKDNTPNGSRSPLLSSTEAERYGATPPDRGPLKALKQQDERPPLSQLFVRPFLLTILNYGLWAFNEMAIAALRPLVYSTPIEYGGLGMDPFTIGVIIGVFGLLRSLLSALFLGRLIRRYGAVKVYKTSILAFLVTFSTFPIANALARRAGRIDAYVTGVLVTQFASMAMTSPCYAAMSILVIENCPSKLMLGSATGVAQMVTSGSRALAPFLSSSLFSLSIQHNLAGGYGVYYFFLILSMAIIRVSQYLPSTDIR